ncbi:MAG TPA: helix-turn-helix domain-containing protein, partial [Actinomycetes bacterium]|nr:helix-turn-helix domain-containing protein [Actinomycetes bacterium]
MGGSSRAEARKRNRAKVLEAARDEFTERGFRDAKIDAIAERAQLTRGGVYSNYPGKRALYFAVLAADAERAATQAREDRPGATGAAEGAAGRPRSARGATAREARAATAREALGVTAREALAAFARAWVARLPLATDAP